MKDNLKLSTEEAKELIDLLKAKVTETKLKFPNLGGKLEFDVIAQKDGQKFIVNITRSGKNKNKCTYQGRTYINSIPLLRLDVSPTATHINPDGEKIVGSHLHIYQEDCEMLQATPFDIEDKDLFENCLIFFEKFNILKSSCDIMYQTEL